jgi:hypothetical protein
MSAACSEMSEEQILHSASSIIRRDIESLDIEHEFYPNTSDVSLKKVIIDSRNKAVKGNLMS